MRNYVSDELVYCCVDHGFHFSSFSCKTKSVRKPLSNHQFRTIFREIAEGGNYQSHGIRHSEVSSEELRRVRIQSWDHE
jgi:hypothetical protein